MIQQRLRRALGGLHLIDFRARRAEFYRDLAEMYQRGEALLSFLEGELANARMTRQSGHQVALRRILQRHQSGENASRLSWLLAGVVPAGDRLMLLAVDRASDKPQALLALAEAVERQQVMWRTVMSYALLPALTLPISVVLIQLLAQVILAVEASTPVFAQEALWAGMNGWARSLAQGAQRWGAPALVLAGLAFTLLLVALPRWRGAVRLKLESWPVFSLYRDFQAATLLSSMAMMLRTGETLQGAIEDLAQHASWWMRWHLGRVLAALDENPTGTVDAFRRGLLSPWLLSRAATLQRSAPSFADVLVQLGTQEGERVLRRVRRSAVIANLALVSVFAAMAIFMGVAAMTVPGRFATLMEPSMLMTLKAKYDRDHPAP